MITRDDLDQILQMMLSHGLRSLDVSQGDARVCMSLHGAEAAKAALQSELLVSAKAVGRFVPAHTLGAATALKPGDAVLVGQHLGYVGNDALLLPIRAAKAGRVKEIHAEAGQLLGYGMPVLTLLVED